jgi:hypothetical protein
VATVESKTSRWAELFRMEDTAQLTPLDRRDFVPVEEARTTSKIYDGARWLEVVDRRPSSQPDDGMPFPLQTVRHDGGMDFYYDDPRQNHRLTWSSTDHLAWQERVADGLVRQGGLVVPNPPFPSAQQLKDWGKAVVLNTPHLIEVQWGDLRVAYEPGKLLRTERWGTNDSLRRTGYRALPEGGYALAWMEESGRETGQNGACWTGYRRMEWGAPTLDTGRTAVAQWLEDRGWTAGVTGPYSRQKTADEAGISSTARGEDAPYPDAGGANPLVCRPQPDGGWLVSGGDFKSGKICAVQVLDATGRVLWQAEIPWAPDVKLPGNWPAGLYTVWVRQGGLRAHVRISHPASTSSR